LVQAAFDGLLTDPKYLNDLIDQGFGKYILAYNMSTILSSVSDNASSLKGALTRIGIPEKDRGKKLKVIGHSRGCLVARKAFGDATSMVLVAGTHQGTPMADAKHLSTLINRVSNLAAITFAGSAILPLFLKGISKVVQVIGSAEGLENQSPENHFLDSLNENDILSKHQLLIGADFEPSSAILKTLDDVALDVVIFGRQKNDGVTPTVSALANDIEGEANRLRLKNGNLHHLNLFQSDEVKNAVLDHFKTSE